jgi:hypothetical protein
MSAAPFRQRRTPDEKARLSLLDKWRLLQSVMRDHSLARNDLIVAMELLDRHHPAISGARASSRYLATATGLARSRVVECLGRLVGAGHFAVLDNSAGRKGRVYAPCGPGDGTRGGPGDGTTNGPAHGTATAFCGPGDGTNKTLRVFPRSSRLEGISRLGAPLAVSALPDGAPDAAEPSRLETGRAA